ncbi:hypothetical protein KA005_51955, partial [bacterium]|nr:hypothetical protein [bacterium]
AFSIFFFGLLLASRGIQKTRFKEFFYQPLSVVAHAGMPLVFLTSIIFMVDSSTYQTSWLFTSVVGLLFYLFAAYWAQSNLLTYISIGVLINTLTAVLVVTNAPETIYFITFSIFFFMMFLSAHGLQKTRFKEFTVQPIITVSHAGMPLVLLISILFMVDSAAHQTSWLFTSVVGLLFYLAAAYWTRTNLLTYISLGAGINLITAILTGLEAPVMVYTLVYSILLVVFLGLGILVQKTDYAEFTQKPLWIVSNIGMPIVLVSTLICWLVVALFSAFSASGNNWLVIITFGFGVLFYVLCDVFLDWLLTRWAAAFLFALTFTFTLVALDFSDTASGISLMILSLVYLGIGYLLEQKEGKAAGGWPLYGMAYLIAGFVTVLTIPEVDDLILVLFGDAIILGLSAAIHREYKWVYGAAWLFMLPIYLTINLYGPKDHYQGLLLGVLCLNYLVAGYLLGRRELRLGGPFLTAAAFLSILVVPLTWSHTGVATIVLAMVGVLYLFVALWLNWTWLLFPSLAAANLMVLTINDMLFISYNTAFFTSLIISYACVGMVLVIGGFGLRRNNQKRWVWPMYLVGIFNLLITYLAGFFINGWLVVGLSTALSVLIMAFAWVEGELFGKTKIPTLLTYVSIGIIFIAHFFLLSEILPSNRLYTWPGYTAVLCTVFMGLSYLLRNEPMKDIYSIPLRRSGSWLFIVPIAGSIASLDPGLVAVTFGITGIVFTVDAALRRILNLAYLAIGAFIVMMWAILIELGIEEPQAFIIPLGGALLGIGWNERNQGKSLSYRITTLLGLSMLMGSAFVQSLPRGSYIFAILLLGENLMAIFWGIRTRSRGFVQLGVVALIANAIVQLGPGFIDLPRWIQIGVTGGILLGGGMVGLIKREELLATRQKLTEEWRNWES